MASYAANPFYDDPFLTQAASNIAKVFIDPNPGRTQTQRAQARYYTLQGDELENKARSRSRIGSIFAARRGQQLSPEDYATITGAGLEGGIDPKHYQEGNLFYVSNTGQPDSAIARAFVGTGKALGKDQGVSMEDRERVAARENNEAARRAGITAGATIQAAREHEAGADRRHTADLTFRERTRWDKPDNVPEGNAVFFSPDDPRFQGVDRGSIPAPRKDKDRFVVSPNGDGSFTYRRAEDGVAAPVPSSERDRFVLSTDDDGKPVYAKAREGLRGPTPKPGAEHFVPTPDANSPTGYSLAPAGAGVPVAPPASTTKPPPKVSGEELDALEKYALRDVGAADPTTYEVDSQFDSTYGPQRAAARSAMAEAMQQGRNSAEAQATYLKALGIAPGSKWQAPGAISRAFGSKPSFKGPGGAAPPPAAAAPAVGVGAVPPPQQREIGKIYRTPRGPMTWTADGWVPPARVDDGVR